MYINVHLFYYTKESFGQKSIDQSDYELNDKNKTIVKYGTDIKRDMGSKEL